MSKARILADYVAGGTTAAEFDYLDGVTSNIQTQFTAKAPLASPAFTGTPTGITAAHITSGALPVGVTGGSGLNAVPVPSGQISNVFKFYDNTTVLAENTSSTPIVAFDAVSWSATSGRHYIIHTSVSCRPTGTGASVNLRRQGNQAYVGTTDRSAGGTTVDTLLSMDEVGRYLIAASAATASGYYTWSPIMEFTAGSTATHYFYVALYSNSTSCNARMYKTSSAKTYWATTIFEVMP